MSDAISLPDADIFWQNFRRKRVLGKGNFGHALEAERIDNGVPGGDDVVRPQPDVAQLRRLRILSSGDLSDLDMSEMVSALPDKVAVKVILREESKATRLKREVTILNSLDHENVLKSFLAVSENCYIYIVTELCSINLSRMITQLRPCAAIQPLVKQIVNGVEFLHSIGITHRDLKPANVLVNIPEDLLGTLRDPNELVAWLWQQDLNKLRLKVADFGFSRFLPESDSSMKSLSVEGTHCYMSPQMAKASKNNQGRVRCDGRMTDVFSAGLLIYTLLTSTTLFQLEQLAADTTKLLVRPALERDVDDEALRHLLLGMLQWEEDDRIKIQQVVSHEYLKEK